MLALQLIISVTDGKEKMCIRKKNDIPLGLACMSSSGDEPVLAVYWIVHHDGQRQSVLSVFVGD